MVMLKHRVGRHRKFWDPQETRKQLNVAGPEDIFFLKDQPEDILERA